MSSITKNIGEIYITFEADTAAEVVELYRGYRDVEAAHTDKYENTGGPDWIDPPEAEWIEWSGDQCPISYRGNVSADLKLRNGEIRSNVNPHAYDWSRLAGNYSIVAYRVVTP